MDAFEKSLALLEEYLTNTRADEIMKEMSLTDSLNVDGPTMDEYLSEFAPHFDLNHLFDKGELQSFPNFETFSSQIFLAEISETFAAQIQPVLSSFTGILAKEYNQDQQFDKAA